MVSTVITFKWKLEEWKHLLQDSRNIEAACILCSIVKFGSGGGVFLASKAETWKNPKSSQSAI